MKYLSIHVAVILLTVAGAGAHGYVTGRWRPQGAAAAYVLPEVPATCGEWRSEPLPSGLADDPVLKNMTRKYTHPRTGRTLSVSLTLGPAGLVSQHTPEYCYPGSGFKPVGTTQTYAAGESAEFRTAVYRKPAGDALRILWAWSPAGGTWSAPKVPELTFLRGSLHKLYVVSWEADKPPADDAELRDFVAALLAQLNAALAPKDTPAGS
jgi:hypothetical protein